MMNDTLSLIIKNSIKLSLFFYVLPSFTSYLLTSVINLFKKITKK